MEHVNAIVIGAGVVGLAIAARLSERMTNVLIIDQHGQVGEETSSRNSEVIHAGIYYPQHSLKAKLCVQGKHKLYEYCAQRNIPYRKLGKIIVATQADEDQALDDTQAKALANGVDDLQRLSKDQLKKLAPALTGSGGLFSPSTGIIDSHSYMQSLLADIERNQGMFVGHTRCEGLAYTGSHYQLTLNCQGERYDLASQLVINSAGLGAQALAHQATPTGQDIPTLFPCKGHYFAYAGRNPFNHLIYPLPEKNHAGLGIHATLDLAGQLKFGPDTLYQNDPSDYSLTADAHTQLKQKFVDAIQRYWPSIDPNKLHPSYTGIRPKLSGPDQTAQDFVIRHEDANGQPGLVQLFGIESPGLTSSLAIADHVVSLLASAFTH